MSTTSAADDGFRGEGKTPVTHEHTPEDTAARFAQTLQRLVTESEGRYTEDDALLVTEIAVTSGLLRTLTAREMPERLRASLESAAQFRRLLDAAPDVVTRLLSGEIAKTSAQIAKQVVPARRRKKR